MNKKLKYTPLIELVRGKFLKCLCGLKKDIHFVENVSDVEYFVGVADYDPITSESFLSELCAEFLTEDVSIHYLNIDLALVIKTIRFNPHGTSDEITTFRCDHSGLHNVTVEGSYFAIDNNHAWSIFYDALEDIFLLHIKDRSKLDIFSDSLIPN